MRVNRAIIFCNGEYAKFTLINQYIEKETLLIGCDGGASHLLKLDLTPHIIIGDFDSLRSNIKKRLKKKQVKFITYPKEKNETDAQLAVQYALNNGCKDIIITGVAGTRLDHLSANIFLLTRKDFLHVNLRIIEGNQEMFLIRHRAQIHGSIGETLSLLPLEQAVAVWTKGLFYPLKKETLSLGTTRGISNIFTENEAEVNFQKGLLLAVHTKKV